jgi:DNA-directed RNA polymerase subunit RPC12/RpoP
MTFTQLIPVIFSIGVMIFMIFGCIKTAHQERRDWNNGYCPKCGKKLVHFDTDSQGGHGWQCPDCGNFVWVSYKRFVYKRKDKK